MTHTIDNQRGWLQSLLPELRDALSKASLPSAKHGLGSHTVELVHLRPLLQPALLALDACGYTLQVARSTTLRTICHGVLTLGKHPAEWSIDEWLHVRRLFSGNDGLALMLVAVRGYKTPSSQQLHPLFRVCSALPLARRLFGRDAVEHAVSCSNCHHGHVPRGGVVRLPS